MKYFIYVATLILGLNAHAFTIQGTSPIDKGEINLTTQQVDPITLTFKNNSSATASFSPTLSNANFKISVNRCTNVAVNKTCQITIAPQRTLQVGEQEIQVGDALITMTLVKKDGNGQVIPEPSTAALFEFVPSTLSDIPFTASDKTKTISLSVKNTGKSSEIPNVAWLSNLNNAKITINRCTVALAPGKTCAITVSVNKPATDVSQSLQVTYSGTPVSLVFNIKAVPTGPTCVGSNNTDGTGQHAEGQVCVSNTRLCSNPPPRRMGYEFWVPSSSSWNGTCSNVVCAQGEEIDGECPNYIEGVTLMNDTYNYYMQYNCSATGSFSEFLDINGGTNGADKFFYLSTSPSFSRSNAVLVNGTTACNSFPNAMSITSTPGTFSASNIVQSPFSTEDTHYRTATNHISSSGGSFLLRLRRNNGFFATYSSSTAFYIRINSTLSTNLRSATASVRATALNRLKLFIAAAVVENQSNIPTNYYGMNPTKILAGKHNIYYSGGSEGTTQSVLSYTNVYLFKQKKGRDDSVPVHANFTGNNDPSSRDVETILSKPIDFSVFNDKLVVSFLNSGIFTIRSIDDKTGTVVDTPCPTTCTGTSIHRIYNGYLYVSTIESSQFTIYRTNDGVSFSKIFETSASITDDLATADFFGNYLYMVDRGNSQKVLRINLTTLATESVVVTVGGTPINYRLHSSTFSRTNNFMISFVQNLDTNDWYILKYNNSASVEGISMSLNDSNESFTAMKSEEFSRLFITLGSSLYLYDGTNYQLVSSDPELGSACNINHSIMNKVTGNLWHSCNGGIRVYGINGFIKTNNSINGGGFESQIYDTSKNTFTSSPISPYLSPQSQIAVVYKGKQYVSLTGDSTGSSLWALDENDNMALAPGGSCTSNSHGLAIRTAHGATFIVDDNNLYFSGNTCRGEGDEAGYGGSGVDTDPPFSGTQNELQKLYVQ